MNAWDTVIEDMQRRKRMGERVYGKGVDPLDQDEDWLQHAYMECRWYGKRDKGVGNAS